MDKKLKVKLVVAILLFVMTAVAFASLYWWLMEDPVNAQFIVDTYEPTSETRFGFALGIWFILLTATSDTLAMLVFVIKECIKQRKLIKSQN